MYVNSFFGIFNRCSCLRLIVVRFNWPIHVNTLPFSCLHALIAWRHQKYKKCMLGIYLKHAETMKRHSINICTCLHFVVLSPSRHVHCMLPCILSGVPRRLIHKSRKWVQVIHLIHLIRAHLWPNPTHMIGMFYGYNSRIFDFKSKASEKGNA